MRADVSGQGHFLAIEPVTRDVQRWKAFIGCIGDLCAQTAQGIYQDADGALLHTGCSCQDMGARRDAEVSREETHGCACRADVDGLCRVVKGLDQDARIVAITKV